LSKSRLVVLMVVVLIAAVLMMAMAILLDVRWQAAPAFVC
jgi:hypothetical protein